MDSARHSDAKQAIRNSRPETRPFPPRFRDKRLEALFRRDWYQSTAEASKTWKRTSLTSYLIMTALLAVAAEPGFFEFQWFRFAVCIPLQIAGFVHALSGRFSERSYYTLFLATSFATFGNAHYSILHAPPADSILYLYESTAIFVFIHCFYPARFAFAFTFSAVATTGALIGLSSIDLAAQMPHLPLDMLLLGTLSLAVICNFSCYLKESFARRNFAQIRMARNQTREADRLASRAVSAAEAKTRFLAIAAHELRTPLNHISGFSELVRSGIGGPIEDRQIHDRCLHIETLSRHMTEVVERVLENSRTAETESKTEDVTSLAALLQDAASRGSKSGLHTSVDPELSVTSAGGFRLKADRSDFALVLDNLVALNRLISGSDMELALLPAVDRSGDVLITGLPKGTAFETREDGHMPKPGARLPLSHTQLTESLARSFGGQIVSFKLPGCEGMRALRLPRGRLSDPEPAANANPADPLDSPAADLQVPMKAAS